MKKLMNIRLSEITEKLESQGSVNARELAGQYQVSMETIRKDLTLLEEMGIAKKEYGGASLSVFGAEKGMELRIRNAEKKQKIANAAIKLCKEFNTIFLDAGSTCLKCVKGLNRLQDKNIITTSIAAFEQLDGKRNEIFLVGGKKREKNQALVGAWSESIIRSVHADVCLLGTAGLLDASGPTTHSYRELSLKQAMMENSDLVYVLADSQKFLTSGLHTAGSWDDVDALITDADISAELYSSWVKKASIQVAGEDV